MATTEVSKRRLFAPYIRNFIFGVEDSLVSTVGLLSGVAIAGVPRSTIFLTGVVLIFVEAFSMGAGSFLSESSADEYMSGRTQDGRSFKLGTLMFVSYFIAGFIPLFPYVLFETAEAFSISIVCSLVALFVLGLIGGRVTGRHVVKHGIRMLVVGGLAIGVGILAGQIVGVVTSL